MRSQPLPDLAVYSCAACGTHNIANPYKPELPYCGCGYMPPESTPDTVEPAEKKTNNMLSRMRKSKGRR